MKIAVQMVRVRSTKFDVEFEDKDPDGTAIRTLFIRQPAGDEVGDVITVMVKSKEQV